MLEVRQSSHLDPKPQPQNFQPILDNRQLKLKLMIFFIYFTKNKENSKKKKIVFREKETARKVFPEVKE